MNHIEDYHLAQELQVMPYRSDIIQICSKIAICDFHLYTQTTVTVTPSKQSRLADVSLTSVQRQFNVEMTLD